MDSNLNHKSLRKQANAAAATIGTISSFDE